MTIVKPLYGHENLETAYCAEDYPYGRLRTKMYFWLETKDKKGVRVVSQSLNPKTGRMNKPHAGTYHTVTANLYLDERGHCQFAVVNEYTEAQKVYEFIKDFPQNHRMRTLAVWCKMKYAYCRQTVDGGKSLIAVNGVQSELTDSEKERYTNEMRVWWRAFNLTQQKPEDTAEPEKKG